MAGAATQFERERDRALRGIQLLAAEIRAHELATGRLVALSHPRLDDRLYGRPRLIDGGGDDPS
jgi:hypothetical protein